LQNEGWICHLIGHSHGGNVVIEAAAAYYTDDECIVRIADWIAGKG
jgi:thioesterase domain-containing protein